ncbi:MAG: hypothetical protein HY318_18450 [Armatimonadetes bacterium]|nr:hypothetical protein [Armatimonadota bacterium]
MALKPAKLLVRSVSLLCTGLFCFWLLSLLWQRVLASRPTVLSVRTEPPGAEVVISPPDDRSMRSVGKAPVRLQLSRREANREGVWSLLVRQPGYWPLMVKLPAEAMRGRTKTVEMRLGRFTLESVGALPVVYEEPRRGRHTNSLWRVARLDRSGPPRNWQLPKVEGAECGFSWSPDSTGLLTWCTSFRPFFRNRRLQACLEWANNYASRLGITGITGRNRVDLFWQTDLRPRLLKRTPLPDEFRGYFVASAFTPDGEGVVHDWCMEGRDRQFASSIVTRRSRQLTGTEMWTHEVTPAVSKDGKFLSFLRGPGNSEAWILRSLRFPSVKEKCIAQGIGPSFGDIPISFSPTGEWIALVAGGRLLLSHRGNPPRTLCSTLRSPYPVGPQWSGDGNWLALGSARSCSPMSMDFSVNHGYARTITGLYRLAGGRLIDTRMVEGAFAGWLPDHQHFLVWDPNDCTVSVVDTQGKVKSRYGASGKWCQSPQISPSGKLIASVVDEKDGGQQFCLFETNAPIPKFIPMPGVSIDSFRWSGERDLLVLTSWNCPSLWSVNVDTGERKRVPSGAAGQGIVGGSGKGSGRLHDEITHRNSATFRRTLLAPTQWSRDGVHAVVPANGHLWLYRGQRKRFWSKFFTSARRITPLGDQCFRHPVVAPTVPPKIRQTRSGWIVQPDS